MIWVALLLFAAIALAPVAFTLRRGLGARGRRDAALALHRAQLAELDRDAAEGRLAPPEHAQAVLEVQRRMLAEAERIDAAPRFAPRASVVMVMLLVPAGALALYLIGGAPGLPAQPLKERIARAEARTREEAALIDQLRAKLATLDPNSEQARQGYLLLGRVELSRGHLDAAAAAWNTALTAKFDPTLAVETAEVETEASGRVTDASAALFRKALDAAPADAPWRPMAEKRLAEAKAGSAITPPSASDAASGAKMN